MPDYRKFSGISGPVARWVRTPLLARLRPLAVLADQNWSNRVTVTQTGTLLALKTESDSGTAQVAFDLDTPLEKYPTYGADYDLFALRTLIAHAPEETLEITITDSPNDPGNRPMKIVSGPFMAVLTSLRQ